jgi:hypothetical protein
MTPEEDAFVSSIIDTEVALGMDEMQLLGFKKAVESAREILSRAVNAIQMQIDEAKERRFNGEQLDPDWRGRVGAAQRAKSWQRQRLQEKSAEIGRRLKAIRHQQTLALESDRDRSQHHLFVEVAKMKLPPETYQEIWDAVARLAQKVPN